MQIGKLDHVNLRTANLEAMTEWYERVLGLKSGPRPGFAFPGAWLYAGEHAAVHLVGVDAQPEKSGEPSLEHFAFSATGREAFLARLESEGIDYQTREVPDFGITQVNIWDPDGNHLHVDFTDGEG